VQSAVHLERQGGDDAGGDHRPRAAPRVRRRAARHRILNRLLQAAPRFLRPGGWLAFEVGLGQGPGLRQRLVKQGAFDHIESFADPAGQVRALAARVAGEGTGAAA
jgi:methylase of polypeptide subunit release factors